MKVLREVGGILALTGGGLVLASVFDNFLFALQNGMLCAYINLIFGIVAIIGGLMGMAYKRIGGILPLIVGILFIVFGVIVLVNSSLATELQPFSYLAYLLGINPSVFLWQITFESMMILAGGILILAGGEE